MTVGVGDPRHRIVRRRYLEGGWRLLGRRPGVWSATSCGSARWRALPELFSTPLWSAMFISPEAYPRLLPLAAPGQKTFENWKRGTSWGKLFEHAQGGPRSGHESRRRIVEAQAWVYRKLG
jgi:hypothetical protein